QNQLDQAIEKYTFAVQVDPKFLKAFQARADVYELQGKLAESAADRRSVAELDPNEPAHAAKAAKTYLDLGEHQVALALCDRALAVDQKCMEALQVKVRACLATGDVDGAVATADAALAVKATTDTYYLHGLSRMASHDYKTAEIDLDRVIEWNYLYEPAYVALAETQLELYSRYSGLTMQMRTVEKAIEKCTRALELNTMSTDALFTRSKALALQKEYAKAIDDVSRCIALGREDDAVYFQRAVYYHGFGQHQNAVNDLNKVLLNKPKDLPTILLRAECKEANLDLEGAKKDLDAALKIMDEPGAAYTAEERRKLQDRRTELDARIFEMNRESDPPYITVVEPSRKENVVQVSSALAQVKVTGHVRDRNLLKSITVNGVPASFSPDEKDPEFFVSIPLAAQAKAIDVKATDLYDNVATVSLTVERSEGVAPTLAITSPSIPADRVIRVAHDKQDLFLEGNASDPSRIRSVTVDGVFASFVPDTTSTEFSIKLPLSGKSGFTVRAEDQFGNSSEITCSIHRETAKPVVPDSRPLEVTATKPAEKPAPVSSTGVTWVIFIENSDYKSFPALQGPATDVEKMRKAFSKYSIQRTITKKNLTKSGIERFFNIELRDLVRTNKVNTVLVWYAGHGRTVSGRTYWIPVDGKKDDIYTFYNYGPLKGLIGNYSESVTNTLVVSDAAGADPSFYEIAR
ncbi:MAG: caspase family protein, partial [Flavobacteriales bacterium]|nr:caspase family protein [Flavobacteriales bacterium]